MARRRSLTLAAAIGRRACPTTMALSANAAVTCRQARAVERFENSHEIAGLVFNAGKRDWFGTIYSRAHGHTYYVFVSPGARIGIVWVTDRQAVS